MGSIDRRIVSSSSRSLLPLAEFDWSSAAPLVAELGIERAVASQYYELRLSAHSEQVDYLCSFSRSSAALVRDALAHRISQHAEHRTNAWRAIQRFLCAWTDSESLCARRCSALWFEFDDYARQASGAVPSVSVCLTQNYSVDFEPPAQEVGDIALAHESLTLLGSEDQGGAQLTTAFHELPSRGRWIHLSYMAGRSPKAIKLYGMMPRAELIAYLTRIGWAGSMRAVEAALADLYPERILGNELYLDLNLENFRDSERATLGLAAAQQHLNRPDSDPTRAEILAHWLKAGLCAFPKVDRVRTWPASAWDVPQNLFMQELRYLDLKLVWQAPTGWIAKAYLGRRQRRGIF